MRHRSGDPWYSPEPTLMLPRTTPELIWAETQRSAFGEAHQGSLHIATCKWWFPTLFWWEKQHVSNGQNVSFKEPCKKCFTFWGFRRNTNQDKSSKEYAQKCYGGTGSFTRTTCFALSQNVQVIQGELNVSFQCQPWKPDSKESPSKHEFRGQG